MTRRRIVTGTSVAVIVTFFGAPILGRLLDLRDSRSALPATSGGSSSAGYTVTTLPAGRSTG